MELFRKIRQYFEDVSITNWDDLEKSTAFTKRVVDKTIKETSVHDQAGLAIHRPLIEDGKVAINMPDISAPIQPDEILNQGANQEIPTDVVKSKLTKQNGIKLLLGAIAPLFYAVGHQHLG